MQFHQLPTLYAAINTTQSRETQRNNDHLTFRLFFVTLIAFAGLTLIRVLES